MKKVYVTNDCIGCGACEAECPIDCITLKNGQAYIDSQGCVGCEACKVICPVEAIELSDGTGNNNLMENRNMNVSYGIENFFADSKAKEEGFYPREVKCDGAILEFETCLTESTSVFVYFTGITSNGKDYYILYGKLLDEDSMLKAIYSDNNLLAEVAKKWPDFYGLMDAGTKNAYTDAAIISLNGATVIATKFDLSRLSGSDPMDYVGDKVKILLDHFIEVRKEWENIELNLTKVKAKTVFSSAVQGYKNAKLADGITNVLFKILGW